MPDQRPKGILNKTNVTSIDEIYKFIQILPDNDSYKDLIKILKIQLDEFKSALTNYPIIKMMIFGFPPENAITNFISQINTLTLAAEAKAAKEKAAEAKAEKEEIDTEEEIAPKTNIAPETKIAPKELSSTLYTVYKSMKECKVASQSFLDDFLLKLLDSSLNDPIAEDKKQLLEVIQKDVIRLKGTTKGRELAELCIEYIHNPTDENLARIEKKTLEHRHPLSFFRPKYPTSYQHFIIAKFQIENKNVNTDEFNKLPLHEQFLVVMYNLGNSLTKTDVIKVTNIKRQHPNLFKVEAPMQLPNSTGGPPNK